MVGGHIPGAAAHFDNVRHALYVSDSAKHCFASLLDITFRVANHVLLELAWRDLSREVDQEVGSDGGATVAGKSTMSSNS